MQKILRGALIPGFLTATLLGVTLLPIQPANARPRWARDIGIGAATGAAGGAVMGSGKPIRNGVNGAAAGAAVSATRRAVGPNGRSSRWGIIRDAGVGAAASVVTGKVTGAGSTGGNAVRGAATGAIINIFTK
jgi:hypothetical protein